MQVIEQQPGWGTTIGSALGEGLKNIANYKMQQLMERQAYKQQQERGTEVWRNLGFPEQQAKAFGSMPAQMQQKALVEFAPHIASNMRGGQQQAPIQQTMAQLQQPQHVPTQAKQQPMPRQPQQQQPSAIEQALMTPNPIEQRSRQAIGATHPMMMAPQMGQRQQQEPEQKATTAKPIDLEKTMPMTRSEAILRKEEIKEEKERRKEEIAAKKEMKKEQRIEQEKIETDNKPFIDEMRKARNAAKYVEPRVLRQEKIVKSGKLPYASTHNFLKFMGSIPHHLTGSDIDFTFLEGASATEFDKLSKEYMKFLKDYFGSRILQIDVENFLKTIPDLAQTDQGKWRIIQNMKAFGDVGKIKSDAMNEIIRENGGKQPRDLEGLVEKRTQPQVDKILDQFIQGTYGGELEYEGGLWGAMKAYSPLQEI